MRIFEESQKIIDNKLFYGLFVVLTIPIVSISKQWISSIDKSLTSNLDLVLSASIILVVIFFLFSIKLKTRIDNEGIKYQVYPIHFKIKFIPWSEINKFYIRKYSPISEYGGWGYRINFFNKNKGKAINISGNIGIQLELKSDKKLLIGTRLKEKAEQTLLYYKNKKND